MSAPFFLVTNDDGYNSPLLQFLVRFLAGKGARVAVAAPLREQSWIGRAVTRRDAVQVEEWDFPDAAGGAWKINGTPTDCVNIALGHLLDVQPDAVFSGINIGHNLSLPFILSSGTVGGAIEGALWGLPAVALSRQIQEDQFEKVAANRDNLLPDMEISLTQQMELLWSSGLVPRKASPTREVLNINLPAVPEAKGILNTCPAPGSMAPIFGPEEGKPNSYRFMFAKGSRESVPGSTTDAEAMDQGNISITTLPLGKWCQVCGETE